MVKGCGYVFVGALGCVFVGYECPFGWGDYLKGVGGFDIGLVKAGEEFMCKSWFWEGIEILFLIDIGVGHNSVAIQCIVIGEGYSYLIFLGGKEILMFNDYVVAVEDLLHFNFLVVN
jgi:hypothetical protein